MFVKAVAKLTWVEIKLFLREPITIVFTLALPLIMLITMGEVFGKAPADPRAFRGVGAMNYYAPSYIGLVIASIGLIALPVHLAGYRERGVLRRLRASSLPPWGLFLSQVAVCFMISVVCAILLVIPTLVIYDVVLPASPGLLLVAFVLCTLSFAALGVLLGSVLPTTRAAQGVGMPLFFLMFVLSGTGPPREVMTLTMQRVGEAMPLWYVVTLMQDIWLGFGWNVGASLIVMGILLLTAAVSFFAFRWE